MQFTVRALDDAPGSVVALAPVTPPGLPAGALFEEPIPGNPVQAQFSWTPAPGQTGDHRVVFRASSTRDAELVGLALCRVFFKVSAGDVAAQNGTLREKVVVEMSVEVGQPGEVVVLDARTGASRVYPVLAAAGTGTGRFLVGPLDIGLPDGALRIVSVEKQVTVVNLEAVSGGVVFSAVLEKTVEVEVDSASQTLVQALEFAGFIPVATATAGARVQVVDGPRVVAESEEVIDP